MKKFFKLKHHFLKDVKNFLVMEKAILLLFWRRNKINTESKKKMDFPKNILRNSRISGHPEYTVSGFTKNRKFDEVHIRCIPGKL